MGEIVELIKKLNSILEKMDDFCTSKSNMFLTITKGLDEAEEPIFKFRQASHNAPWFSRFIPYDVGLSVGKKLKEAKKFAHLKKDTSQTWTLAEKAVETPATHH